MMDRPFSSNVTGSSDRAADGGFTLVALHSADRMTRSLSPWTRQMLGEEPDLGMARHTVLNRVLRRRSLGSSTFSSTLSILRRFHRIVTRTTAWKIGVGSVDPNLFDRFVTDLIKRQRIGANNIPSLISLGEQRRREMDMPLAGAIGEIAPTSASDSISASSMASQMGFGSPSSVPSPASASAPAENKPLTMEEIKRRIEEAKRFKSNTPGSVPDFVRATQQPKADTPATPPTMPSLPPGFPPVPGQPMPPNVAQRNPAPPTPSVPRPPESLSAPSTESTTEQRVPPRLRRRRFASVEYVSLPNAEDDDGGDKDEPSSLWRFATGPPGDLIDELSQWIDPFIEEDEPSRPPASARRRDSRRTPSPARAESLATPSPLRRAASKPLHRRGRLSDRSNDLRGAAGRQSAAPSDQRPVSLPQRRASIVQRPLSRLMDTLSGQMLASRPQQLMAQVLRKEIAPPVRMVDRSALSPTEPISFAPAIRPPVTLDEMRLHAAVSRQANDGGWRSPASPWLAISPDDFTLTPPFSLRIRRPTADDSPAEEMPPTAPIPPQRVTASPVLRAARVALSAAPEPATQRSSRTARHRRPTPSPSRRRTEDSGRSLAQLQVASPSTWSGLASSAPLLLSAQRLDRIPSTTAEALPLIAPVIQHSLPGSAPQISPVRRVDQDTRPLPLLSKWSTPSIALTEADITEADLVARRIVDSTSRQVSKHHRAVINPSPLYRPFRHLQRALTGEILASRPQQLMAQILIPAQREPSLLPPHTPPLADLRSVASSSTQRRTPAPRLPISMDDFVLPPVRRISTPQKNPLDLPDSATSIEIAPESVLSRPPRLVSPPRIMARIADEPVEPRRTARRPLPAKRTRTESKRRQMALVQLQAAALTRPKLTADRTNLSPMDSIASNWAIPFEPVSALWRQAQVAPADLPPSPRPDAPLRPASPPTRGESTRLDAPFAPPLSTPIRPAQASAPRLQRTTAQLIPLELSMRRLLGSRVDPTQPTMSEQPLPQRRGETFAAASPAARPSTAFSTPSPISTQRTTRRIARSPHTPTLMERLLNRDFAGTRIQSISPVGMPIEPSSRPLSVLARDLVQRLPHQEVQRGTPPAAPLILARRAIPTLPTNSAPTSSAPISSAAPMAEKLALPARPHLTRQLSQQLVRISQTSQESSLQRVERALIDLASSARLAHRFAPSSRTWKAQPTAPSPFDLPATEPSAPTPIASSLLSQLAQPVSPVPPLSLRTPRIAPVSRASMESRESQRTNVDADRVRSLLEPGTLSVETLSDSSLLQRATPSIALPLTDFVLARADGSQRMRTSQPALPPSLVTAPPTATPPTPFSPLRPQPAPLVQRTSRRATAAPLLAPTADTPTAPTRQPAAARTKTRRALLRPLPVPPFRVDGPLPNRDLRRAVQTMADKPQRYVRVEPVSQLWRSTMLATPSDQPAILPTVSPRAESVQRRRTSATVGVMPQRLTQDQPADRPLGAPLSAPLGAPLSAPLSAPQPLPLAPRSTARDQALIRRASIRVADADEVTAAALSLSERSRAERTVYVQRERATRPRSIRSDLATTPAPTSRLIRRKAQGDSARPTLLERVAARDFADLRREHLAEGPLVLPSPARGRAAVTIPDVGSAPGPEPILTLRQLSKELIQRSALSTYPNLGSSPTRLQPPGIDFDPVSMAWPRMDWPSSVDNLPQDQPSTIRRGGSPRVRRAAAQVIPLELAMQRLLGARPASDSAPTPSPDGDTAPRAALPQAVGRVTPPVAVAPMVTQMERQGWRFKRAARAPKAPPRDVQRSVESLDRPRSRPLARPVRTLMERVLGRDFAGVRVQTASMAPLGIEAATRGDTVFLSESASRLDRPQSLGVLAHELTHVAARNLSPRQPSTAPAPLMRSAVQPSQRTTSAVQREMTPLIVSPRRFYPLWGDHPRPSSPEGTTLAEQPLAFPRPLPVRRAAATPAPRRSASPLRPHLTRQLSQRLVQMSLAQEERTAAEVEAAVVRMASSARVARRFAPASHLWQLSELESSPKAVEVPDLAESLAPLTTGAVESTPLSSGRGRLRTLPTLDLPTRPSTSDAVQREPDNESPARAATPRVQPERTIAALEAEGWRFKRAERPRLVAPDRIQRAVAQLQQRADRGMPLPRQPRTLMERVLQRDFSRVRVQTAPLQALGVEAAARENTVYLAREQSSRLDRPENLALLGHELTHVAASGNAPVQRVTASTGELPVVQRRSLEGDAIQRTPASSSSAMPLRPLLPATIQRTLAGEESAAAGVEEGLRTFLRQSAQSTSEEAQPSSAAIQRSALPVVQRAPLTARVSHEDRVQRLPVVDEAESALPRLGVSPVQLKRFRGGEPTLSGVPSVSMDVAPRTPVIRRMPAQDDPDFNGKAESPKSAPLATVQSSQPSSAPVVQRVSSNSSNDNSTKPQAPSPSNSVQQSFGENSSSSPGEEEPNWNQLAEKVYPMVRRLLMIERERRPL